MKNTLNKPTREQEIKRLAETLLLYLEPHDLLEGEEVPDEVAESNTLLGYEITSDEVAACMDSTLNEWIRKRDIEDLENEKKLAAARPFAQVRYRDWLAGMIYANNAHHATPIKAIAMADAMINALYPLPGEPK